MNASDYRAKARENLAGNWGLSILVALIAALLGGAVSGSTFSLDIDTETLSKLPPLLYNIVNSLLSVTAVLSLVQFFIGGAIKLGNCHYLLGQHDQTERELKDLFSELGRWGAGFVLNLLTTLFTILWTLLFIIPGIVAAYSYAMAPFILAEHPEMSAKEAIAASKEMMKGHRWELFCLDFSFIGWSLLCVLTLGIGYLFLNPYMSAARTAFYRNLCPLNGPEPEAYIPPVEF